MKVVINEYDSHVEGRGGSTKYKYNKYKCHTYRKEHVTRDFFDFEMAIKVT